MIAAWMHLAITVVATAVTLGIMLTLLRGRPVGSLGALRRMGGPFETATRFHRYGYIVLALLAISDAVEVYAVSGTRGSLAPASAR